MFAPEPNQELKIQETIYSVSEHPILPGMPYGQEGRRAVVYQLSDKDGGLQALKVFKPRFRMPRMVAVAEKLAPYASLGGLRACQRTVLTSTRNADLLIEHPDLVYAVLMPWIEGATWQEFLLSEAAPAPEQALQSARSLVEILVTMEERGLAHCDLSGSNLIISPEDEVALVDLEEMFGPGFLQPEVLPAGSPGYAHKNAPHGLWSGQADRFAGTVLMAEMLGWCDPRVRAQAFGDSYFSPEEIQIESERYHLLALVLKERWGKRIASLLENAWRSDSLSECATFGECYVALLGAAPGIAPEVGWSDEPKDEMVLPDDDLVEEDKEDHWVCDQCGKAVSLNLKICPYCEQGEQPSLGPSAAFDEGWRCSNCGKLVSYDQRVCPHCEVGEQYSQEEKPTQKRKIPVWAWFAGGIAALFGIVAIWSWPPPPTITDPPTFHTPTSSSTPDQITSTAVPEITASPTPDAAEGSSMPPRALPITEEISVQANELWQDTGIEILEGDTVEIIILSGQWRSSPEYPWVNGKNCSNDAATDTILRSASEGSLIARIGSDLFCVGASSQRVSITSGNLMLSFNDCASLANCFSDNEGSLWVQVNVKDGAALTILPTPSPTGSNPSTQLAQPTEKKSGMPIEQNNLADLQSIRNISTPYQGLRSAHFPRLAFSPDGNLLAVGHMVAFSPDGEKIIADQANLYQIDNGKLIASFQSPTADRVAIWDVDSKTLLREIDIKIGYWNGRLAVSPDGSVLAIAPGQLYDGSVAFYRMEDGKFIRQIQAQSARLDSLEFSSDGYWITTTGSGGISGLARLWRVSDGTQLRERTGSLSAISPDLNYWVVYDNDYGKGETRGLLYVGLNDGSLKHIGDVTNLGSNLTFSPSSELLAGCLPDGIRFWQAANGDLEHKLNATCQYVVFSPDGTLLAYWSDDGQVTLLGIP